MGTNRETAFAKGQTGEGGGQLGLNPIWARLRQVPVIYPLAAVAALVIQFNPEWRAALLYDRAAVSSGQVWRLWTGHFVHFGWPHFIADTGLLLLLGWAFGARHPWASRLGFALMPPFIAVALYLLDPAMARYGGLSALDLGLLLLFVVQNWERKWTDWFWPAVLAIYVGEVIIEFAHGGRGGGMIGFDDSSIRVATSAHLAAGAYALLAWVIGRRRK